MKKFPVLLSLLLVVGVVASLAFTHPISSQNGVVRDYSAGSTLTIDTGNGPHTYILRSSTLMWGWGATGFISNTGGNGTSNNTTGSSSSSSSSSSTTSATAAPTMAVTETPMATATMAATETPVATATTTGSGTGSSSGSGTSSGTTSGSTTTAAANVNGLGSGARVTVFAQCFPGTTFRHMNSKGLTGNKGNMSNMGNNGQSNVCFALAVIVRAPMQGTIASTGGTGAASGTSSPTTAATTETPAAVTTETPAVTMTPTP